MSTLPHVDEHTVTTRASRPVLWSRLLEMLRTTMGPHHLFAKIVGTVPRTTSEPFTGAVGDTLPGFRVVEADVGHRLVLEGRHRFSNYRLTFMIDADRIRAITDAEFPGLRGALYRAAVIGSTAHARITRHMLKRVAA